MKVEPLSLDEEEQKLPLLAAAALMDDEFATQMEEAMRRSLIDKGPVPLSPLCNGDV